MQRLLTGPLTQLPTDLLINSPDRLQSRSRAAESTAGAGNSNELRKVAQEFESLFVAHLLKVMRETIEESGLMEGGFGKGIYADLFDQEFSRGIAQHGALGISDLLIKRLSAQMPEVTPAEEAKPLGKSTLPATSVSPQSPSSDSELDVPDFRMPLEARVSSQFGMRKDPFTHQPRFHKGLDLAAPEGTDVRAAMGGEVVFAGYQQGYGNTVVLKHPGGLQTRYAHMAYLGVSKGDSIATEQVLGSVGNTGHSTGPHLHFEVTRWGEQVDPVGSLGD